MVQSKTYIFNYAKNNKIRSMPITKQRHRELMQLAIDEMRKSISEHTERHDPKVGAVLADPDGNIIGKAHRGELRRGDHAEFTLFERKNLSIPLTGSVLYTTLGPLCEKKCPEMWLYV
jgi:ATP-dependent DNA helicase RecG